MNDHRAFELRLRGEAERRADAEPLLERSGDSVLVRRGVLRALLMRCPDGCGDTLLVNLDPRSGGAWRLRVDRGGLSLYPSVWREGGCGSHFIVWQHRIIWCGEKTAGEEPPYDAAVEAKLQRALTRELRSPETLAASVDESPWEVIRAGASLVRAGRARRGEKGERDWFGRV